MRDAFREAGMETTEEFFHFRPSGDFGVRVIMGLALASLALVWAGVWLPWLAVAGFAGLGLVALVGSPLSTAILMGRARAAKEGDALPRRWVRSSNVVARAPGPAGSPLFVFVAHYDSKSQNMPITVRVALFALLGAAGIVACQLEFLHLWLRWPLVPAIHAAFGVAFAAAAPLLALRTGNISPGALDNASGAATLVELARVWRDHPLSWKSRAIFLSPSAEEHGLVGSRLWVARHAGELLGEPKCRVLNFDGCGATGELLVLPGSGVVADAFVAAARAASVRMRRFPLGVGLIADHVPFVEVGIACATLLARGRGTSRIHTTGDSADLLDDAGFEAAGKAVLGAIERLIG
jgi:hypothetical protein